MTQSNTEGRLAYTMQQAIQYRIDTVGRYARLLSDIMFPPNSDPAQRFFNNMMDIQIADDIEDVAEDAFLKDNVVKYRQPNPFVVLFSEKGC